MMIDINKKYQIDGRDVTILTAEAPHEEYPVIGYFNNNGDPFWRRADGGVNPYVANPDYDLIEVPGDPLPAVEPDTVTLPRMTEKEARDLLLQWSRNSFGSTHAVMVLRRLGLIRPDHTPLEQFTAAYPGWREMDEGEAVRLALEWGR